MLQQILLCSVKCTTSPTLYTRRVAILNAAQVSFFWNGGGGGGATPETNIEPRMPWITEGINFLTLKRIGRCKQLQILVWALQ